MTAASETGPEQPPPVGAVLCDREIKDLSDLALIPPGRAPLIADLQPENLKGAAYDLRMAPTGMVLPGGRVVLPTDPPNHAEVLLAPGQTALISTFERLNLPNNLIGNMSIKGELASKGILMLTGLIVDPNYHRGGSGDGRLHFRLANLGNKPVLLRPAETRVASIQFVRLAQPATTAPGRSFEDVWDRVDEFREGLGFLEDLRTLNARVGSLDEEVQRQGRSVSLVVIAVGAVVVTTLLGVLVTGLLTLGSSVDLVHAAKQVVPRSGHNRVLAVIGLFALAALVAALLSPLRIPGERSSLDPKSPGFAREEAVRDLRARRRRNLAVVATLLAILAVAAAALVTEAGVSWWIATIVGLAVSAGGVLTGWGRIWKPISRTRVDQRVREWEIEAASG